MLLEEKDLKERLDSPDNLMNKLAALTNPHRPKSMIPAFLPPKAEDIIENIDEKISNGSIRNKALGLASEALDELKIRIREVQKPRELAAVAEQMSKIAANVEPKNQNEGKQMPQIVIYAPKIMTEEAFNVVDLHE